MKMGKMSPHSILLLLSLAIGSSVVQSQDCVSFQSSTNMAAANYDCSALSYKYREGCKASVQCKPNYYLTDTYAGKHKMQLECSRGRWLYNQNEPDTTCHPGCWALNDNVEMKNATYVSPRPTNIFYNGDTILWPAKTMVVTKCKEGFVFKKEMNAAVGTDDYACMGGDEGWMDLRENRNAGGRAPGQCDPLCNLIDQRDIPNGVVISIDPSTFPSRTVINNGKTYLKVGAQYTFVCQQGYKYEDGKSEQNLMCRGGASAYEDQDNGKSQATINKCISQGCPAITTTNVDTSAVIDRKNCESTTGASPEGCQIEIKCKKPTHYFANPNLGDGYKLSCTKNGDWVDQTGKTVKPNSRGLYTDECLGGCPVPSSLNMANAEYTTPPPVGSSQVYNNGNQQIFSANVRISTRCKDGYGRPKEADRKAEPNTYTCDATYGWINSATGDRNSDPTRCDSGCKLPVAATGTKYANLPDSNIFTSNGQTYATINSRVTVSCDKDFESPTNNDPNAIQSLVCKGDNADGWVDEKTGSKSQQPMTCVRSGAKGCEVATLNNADATQDNCDIVDGLMPEKCKLNIKCKDGFIPSDPNAVDSTGKQSLECIAKNDGWKDTLSGKTNVTPVKCVAGCILNDSLDKSTWSKKASPSDMVTYNGQEYVKQGTTVSVTCKQPYVGKSDNDRNGNPIKYVCRGGTDGWYKPATGEIDKTPGDACGALCDPLYPPATGTLQVTNPQVFEYNGEPKVSEGGRYRFKCANGYKYPEGSPQAANNQEILVCQGDGKGYVNEVANNKSNSVITKCDRGSVPGCSLIDVNNPPSGIKVISSYGCAISNEKTNVNCQVKLECADGYYPKYQDQKNQASQSLKCVDNGTNSNWIDDNNGGNVNIMECIAGCPDVGHGANAEIVSGASPTLNTPAGKYYEVGNKVTVKCIAGSVHKNGDNENPQEAMEYVCRGGSSTPWSNTKNPGFEKTPGDLCVKTCNAPDLPSGMRAVSSPATFPMGDKILVKGGDKYRLRCIDGYHFPAGSPYSTTNEQILECAANTGKLTDVTNGNQVVDGPAKCVKSKGDGCVDLAQKNAKVVKENCPDKKNGADCEIVVQCENGYIPTDSAYHPNGKQALVCKDGYDWVDSITNKTVTYGLECKAACRVDSSATVPGAEITKKSDKSITVDNIVYVENGQKVTIQCKGDEILWESDSSNTPSPHEYTCAGGSLGWKRNDDDKIVVTLGEGCVRTCSPLQIDAPATVKVVKSPAVINYNGKQYVAEGQAYSYKCANDKYEYKSSSPNSGTQAETAKCDGATRTYINPNSGQTFTKPEECARKEGLDECKKIDQNSTATISVTGSTCRNDDDYYPTGCKITTKCKQGYYPTSQTYLNPTGEQEIVCRPGGRGWSDQDNKKISAEMECVKGCINSTVQISDSQTVINRETFTHPNTGIRSTCESRTVDTSTTVKLPDHPYYCPVDNKNDSSYYDKECSNACRELPRPLPAGVTIFKNPIMLDPSKPYTYSGEMYVLKCAAGYVYPKGTKQRDQGRQTLVCDGTTNRYNDMDDGIKGVSPLACEEAKGCAEIAQPAEADITQTGCSFNAPYYNDKCELTINCKAGYYPKDVGAVMNQGQRMKCDEEKDSWISSDGKPVNTAIECVAGCKEINLKESVSWLNETIQDISITNYIVDNKIFTCTGSTVIEKALATIKKALLDENRYYCKRTDLTVDQIINFIIDDSVCKDTCADRKFVLPTGIQIKSKPETFNHNNMDMIGKDYGYTFECKEGYRYNPKSPYAAAKEQKILCSGNGSYYDAQTNLLNPEPSACEKIIGCSIPTESTGVVSTKDASCTIAAAVVLTGCKYTYECADGYYPKTENYQTKPNQTLICVEGVGSASWRDSTSNVAVNALTCEKGCLPRTDLGTDSSTHTTTESITYNIRAIQVVCSKSKVNSSANTKYEDDNLKFYCPVNETSGFLNFTNTPCTNVCSNLTYAPSLLLMGSPSIYIEGLVVSKYTYTLNCPNGKVFKETKSTAREFECDGPTKAYRDLTTNENRIIHVDDTCIEPSTTTTPTTTTTTTTKPPTTTTTSTTTTTTTTTPTTTTPAKCPGISSNGIAATKGSLDSANQGEQIEIACKQGYSPVDSSFYPLDGQTLKCDQGTWVDAKNPGSKLLECTPGCVVRTYEVTNTSSQNSSDSLAININGQLSIKCSQNQMIVSSERKLIGPEHKYLCDESASDMYNKNEDGSISPCTNACLVPLSGDPGVPLSISAVGSPSHPFLKTPYAIYKQKYSLVLDKDIVTVSCKNAGETFTADPSSSSLKMYCNAVTGQYHNSNTDKLMYPTNALPGCGVATPESRGICASFAATSKLTVHRQACAYSGDTEIIGCRVFVVCSDSKKVVSSWECKKDKSWLNLQNGSTSSTIPQPSC